MISWSQNECCETQSNYQTKQSFAGEESLDNDFYLEAIFQVIHSQRSGSHENMTNAVADITTRLNFSSNSCQGLLHETLSPDEVVIQARGRRQVRFVNSISFYFNWQHLVPQVPLTFSPDFRQSPPKPRSTPESSSSKRLLLPSSRDPARKRLRLQDSPPVISSMCSPSPDKQRRSPVSQRIKLSSDTSTEAMKYSQPTPAMFHFICPGVDEWSESWSADWSPFRTDEQSSSSEVRDYQHDASSRSQHSPGKSYHYILCCKLMFHQENLNYLKRNIFKALPSSRLTDCENDSLSYNKVSVHLLSFKKTLSEAVKTLLDSQHWLSLLDFVIMAWSVVRSCPKWTNASHNTIRTSCFRTLSTAALRAMKEGGLCEDSEQCKKIISKLDKLKHDSDEIIVCCKFAHFIMKMKTE